MSSVIIDSVSNPNISALKTVTKKKFLRNYPLQIYRSHEQTHFLYIFNQYSTKVQVNLVLTELKRPWEQVLI